MKHLLSIVISILAGAAAGLAAPAQSEAVVVYNTRVPESKAIALHYAKVRNVPENQVAGFSLSTGEEMSRREFQKELQRPLFQFLVKEKLWKTGLRPAVTATNAPPKNEPGIVESKIRYVVLCYGVPVRIAKDNSIQEEEVEKLRPELQRNEAAVDSELAFLPLLERKLPVGGPLANPLYSATNSAVLHPTNGLLMIARLDGPTPEIARGLVDKAIQAETNGLWGNFYFDLRNINEEGYKIGDTWLRNAAEISKRLGFEPVVDEKPGTFTAGFPMSHIAFYAGWYDENVSGPFAQPKVDFMPGAFAYHLHSLSAGTLRTTNRHWAGPLLAKGATAVMGSVYEPYLAGTPDISIFAARFLYLGFSYGECAYASAPVLSWQTTVIGDPLFRPFARQMEELQQEFTKNENSLLEWYYLRLINLNVANGKSIIEAANLLQGLELTKISAVLTERLASLYAAQGKPSSAILTYENAVKLADGAQRLRLLLTLGEHQQEAERTEGALTTYETLLREYPKYPDRLAIYRKLEVLAGKLNRTADRERYAKEISALSSANK
jgi:uncharacterized protein (TIGR03790 family)